MRCRPLTALVITAALFGRSGLAAESPVAPGADFLRPGPVAPATLPAAGIFPQGRTMHIGGYSVPGAPVKQLGDIVPMELAQKSGFTVAGPYYGTFAGSAAALARAAALGLHIAAQFEVQKEHWPAVRLANLAYGNERVLLLVNSSEQTVLVRLTGIPEAVKQSVVSGGDAAKIARTVTGSEVAMEPFAALVLRLTR